MYKRCLVLIIILLANAWPSVCDAASELQEYKGMRWGSEPSPRMVKVANPWAGVDVYIWRDNRYTTPLFGIPVSTEVFFCRQNALYRVSVRLNEKGALEGVRKSLINAYGLPKIPKPEIGIWQWYWPNGQSEIQITQDASPPSTLVTFATK